MKFGLSGLTSSISSNGLVTKLWPETTHFRKTYLYNLIKTKGTTLVKNMYIQSKKTAEETTTAITKMSKENPKMTKIIEKVTNDGMNIIILRLR